MSVAAMEFRRMKTIRTHLVDKAIWSQNTFQIFPTTSKEVKYEGCDFTCNQLASLKISISRTYSFSQQINTKLC